jgi:SAM-dependent methyltransferase
MYSNKEWNIIFKKNKWGEYPSEDLIRFFAKNLYPKKNLKVLELGSGTGANLWYFARNGHKTYGIEGSEYAVDISIEKLNKESPGWKGEIICGDFSKIFPYKNNFFDAIIDIEAVYLNSPDTQVQILKNVFRCLKKNGFFFSKHFEIGSYGWKKILSKSNYYGVAARGALGNKGKSHFARKKFFNDVFKNNFKGTAKILSVERTERTVNNMKNSYKELLLTAKKI